MPNSHITADTVVHDQSHLEVCLNYPLSEQENNSRRYKIDFYFFIPTVMAITPSSYPKDRFYSDITNYTRAHTPYTESGDEKLLEEISNYISNLISKTPNQKSLKLIIRTVKLFGNTLNKRLQEDSLKNLDQLNQIILIIELYREKCVKKIIKQNLNIPLQLRHVMMLVDEYLSNKIETVLAEINTRTDSEEIRTHVTAVLNKELEYRYQNSDYFFIKKTTDSEKEYFFFRQNLLRKVIALPLFLDVKKKKLDDRYRNIIASLGAALAATWAQLAEHHTYKTTNASDFGFQFITVAAFAVGVYVFKDRIKDLSKEYVSEKLKGHIPDIKGTLVNEDLGISGNTSEYVHYIDEKNISAEVRFLRRLSGRWDVEPPFQDTVLHYHRTVDLKRDPKQISQLNITSIKDILRFNFSFFLKHLDDPIKQFISYDQEDGITKINFPKVYHLNVVIKMSTEMPSFGKKQERIDFERYRLIFNRIGIIRIESLSENQKLFFTQEAE